ncbi:MAG TPA: hypothetical protein VN782_10225 [Usitatibacter sp.]|nr:hypothetical protein [Usitatibacter sp.]
MHSSPLLLMVGLAAALPSAASSASAGARGGANASAAIDLRIAVPKVLELRLLDHPSTVHVSAADAANGEVVVTGPRMQLISNASHGYVVQAAIRGPFTAASIEGLPQPVHIDASGARIAMPSMVGQSRPLPFRVRYRLRLRKDTPPGTYPWPVSVSLEAP